METNLSEKVRERIEACKANKSIGLDLIDCELTIIPKEIKELSWLSEKN